MTEASSGPGDRSPAAAVRAKRSSAKRSVQSASSWRRGGLSLCLMRRAKQDRLAPSLHGRVTKGRMSWTRRFIWAFWICLAVMLCWNLYSCNDKIAQEAAQPKQDHFFFYQPTKETAAAAAIPAGPRVEQTGVPVVEDNTPSPTVPLPAPRDADEHRQGQGHPHVQVCVRPYPWRGQRHRRQRPERQCADPRRRPARADQPVAQLPRPRSRPVEHTEHRVHERARRLELRG